MIRSSNPVTSVDFPLPIIAHQHVAAITGESNRVLFCLANQNGLTPKTAGHLRQITFDQPIDELHDSRAVIPMSDEVGLFFQGGDRSIAPPNIAQLSRKA